MAKTAEEVWQLLGELVEAQKETRRMLEQQAQQAEIDRQQAEITLLPNRSHYKVCASKILPTAMPDRGTSHDARIFVGRIAENIATRISSPG